MDWLGMPAGVVVLLVILMAVFMFWAPNCRADFAPGFERSLAAVCGSRPGSAAVLVLVIGQPSAAEVDPPGSDKRTGTGCSRSPDPPGELLATCRHSINLVMLAQRSRLQPVPHPRRTTCLKTRLRQLSQSRCWAAANTVYVLMSNDESAATKPGNHGSGERAERLYPGGGINHWLRHLTQAILRSHPPRCHPATTC
jgi:hypothetical protein